MYRLSRLRAPRATLAAFVMLFVVLMGYGAVAELSRMGSADLAASATESHSAELQSLCSQG